MNIPGTRYAFALLPAIVLAQSPVEVVTPEVTNATRSLELSASLMARRAADLSPRLPGLVVEVGADVGDQVAAGDLVLRLDPRLAELALAEAEASRGEAQARLDEARRLAEEARRLAADRFVPQTEIAAREAAVGVAAASVSVADAALATARERWQRHEVLAPFDGVIASRRAEVGEWVETGAVLATLVAPASPWVDARAPQQYWTSLAGDVTARVFVDALGATLDATVHARVPVSDPDARTFLVRLAINDAPEGVLPGMSARVILEWDEDQEVLYVPRDAIIRYPEGTTTVWVVEGEGNRATVSEREVDLTRYLGDRAEIGDGLASSDSVVVRGNEVLVEGQAVRVLEAKGAR